MFTKIIDFCLDFIIIISSILGLCLIAIPIAFLFIILIGIVLILYIPVIIIAIIWYVGVGIKKLYLYIKNFFKKNEISY